MSESLPIFEVVLHRDPATAVSMLEDDLNDAVASRNKREARRLRKRINQIRKTFQV